MKHVSEVKCCVVDFGLFIHVARRLAREFAEVSYCPVAWETPFPRIRDAVLGDGYEEIKWVESPFDCMDYDLFVFPDIGLGPMQEHLESMGKCVWGCRNADELETRRGVFLKTLKKTGLPVPPHTIIQGLTNLRVFLKENPDKHIKVSTYRGDFETLHFRSMEEDQSLLDHWSTVLGPLQEMVKFFVFDPIEAKTEDGCDTWSVDGVWPNVIMHARECKDKSLVASFKKFSELPDVLHETLTSIGPELKRYHYKGMFSVETRNEFFNDATCRFGSPPSQVQCELLGNLGEIVWYGSNGITIDPEPVKPFGVQAIFDNERDDWTVLKIPSEIDQWVKVQFSCRINGDVCIPPDPTPGSFAPGWVLGIGDSIEDAINHLKENIEQMPGGVEVRIDSLAELLKEAKKTDFTEEPIPEPSIVLT